VGFRFNPWQYQKESVRLVLDLELGTGGGAGGSLNCDSENSHMNCENVQTDHLNWSDRTAYGAYVGAGLGLWFNDFFSVFARGRFEVSKATNIPVTYFGGGLGGIAFKVHDMWTFHLGGGLYQYHNEVDSDVVGTAEAGMSVKF
jgi:hypothetical protein